MRAEQENNFKRTPNSERMDTENIHTLSPGIGMFSAQLFDGTISSADLQAEELQINKYIFFWFKTMKLVYPCKVSKNHNWAPAPKRP